MKTILLAFVVSGLAFAGGLNCGQSCKKWPDFQACMKCCTPAGFICRQFDEQKNDACTQLSTSGCKGEAIGTKCVGFDGKTGACWPVPATAGDFCICGKP